MPGIERIRFTSPHPRDFTDDVIEAMAETPAVMPSLHMPLQSGSDRILRAMRRSYRRERYLGHPRRRPRDRIPDAAITTDIIVGFPGETEEDFAATLDVVEAARFSSAFTFQYSPRPGTPAAEMADQVPKAGRPGALRAAGRGARARSPGRRTAGCSAPRVEVLVSQGEGRKDEQTRRMSGRARDGRLVHFAGAPSARPGDCVDGHASSPLRPTTSLAQRTSVRRTRAGDAWEAGQASCGTPAAGPGARPGRRQAPVALGMPGSAACPVSGRPRADLSARPRLPDCVVAIVGPTATGKSDVAVAPRRS